MGELAVKKMIFLTFFIINSIIGTMYAATQIVEPITKEDGQTEPSIFLNFENASLASVVNYLTERKNINLIPHKNLENIKVTLTSRKPMRLSEAWDSLYTLLEANNLTMIEVNGVHRIIPMQEHPRNPLLCFSSAKGINPEQLPDNNQVIRYIYFCRNIKANTANSILSQMLTPNSVQVNSLLEACIITEKSLHIKSAMRIITELDKGGLRESIKVIQLTYAKAERVAQLFTDISGQKDQSEQKIRFISPKEKRETSYFSKDIKIIPEPIQNKLILMGTSDNIDKIIEFVSKYIDTPIGTAESRLHIKEVKYMPAEKLKIILERILQAGNKGNGKTLVDGKYRYFEDVVISAETPNNGNDEQGKGSGNRLIIACGKEDWIRINTFIDRLDKPQPQVALEIMVVDLSIDDERSLGAQTKVKGNLLGNNVQGQSFTLANASNITTLNNNMISTAGALSGATILTLGNTTDVWSVIRSAYKISHSNIISQPFLVANNNMPCEEEIAVQKYIETELVGSSGYGGTVKKTPVKASTRAKITPRINASGIIDLTIEITVNEFKAITNDSPDIRNREIKTRALMSTGEVLVIGGLTNNKQGDSRWKIPLLGDIPILGTLFKDRSKTQLKKSLYVFIRPSIIKPNFGGIPDDYTQLKLDYAKYQIMKHDDFASTKDPIQRWYFKPNDQTIKQKLTDVLEGRMRPLDDFIERKTMPTQVQISQDPYFKAETEETDSSVYKTPASHKHAEIITYEPEEFKITMPHMDPEKYNTPGLIEASLPQQQLEGNPPAQMPAIAHLQRRSGIQNITTPETELSETTMNILTQRS